MFHFLDRPAADNGFFGSVATDGNWLIIGASGETSRRGAAYVYSRDGSTWTLKQRLGASNAAENDGFESAIAVQGNTLVIGSYNKYVAARGRRIIRAA